MRRKNPGEMSVNNNTERVVSVTLLLGIGLLCLLLFMPSVMGGQEAPIADFSYSPSSPSSEETIRFSNETLTRGEYILDNTWNFGDGAVSSKTNPKHSYSSAGTYTVTLTVTDNDEDTDTCSKNVTVANAPPDADFTCSPSSPAGNTIQFKDKSTDADGEIKTYRWEFGDGKFSTAQNPSHLYKESGTYTATLTVTDGYGDTGICSKEVKVSTTKAPQILGVEAEKDKVSRRGENLTISFQIYEESGINNIRTVEIWVKDEDNRTESYDNWPEGGIKVIRNSSPYENTYSLTFDPDNTFDTGEASVKIKATDKYGLKSAMWEENLFAENATRLMLIQEELVEATKGELTVVSLEIANLSSEEVEAVRVLPPENYRVMPSTRWIGSMDVDSYLPADFKLYPENMRDGENLTFYAVYRTDGEPHKSPSLTVTVNLKKPEEGSKLYFAIVPAIAALVILTVVYFLRWR